MDGKSRKIWREKGVKSAMFSSSFERQMHAKTVNAREQVRLEKQQREIELFKNDAVKTMTAEKRRVKSRMRDLRKVVYRTQSIETISTNHSKDDDNLPCLPKLSNATENGKTKIVAVDFCQSVPDLHLLGGKEKNLCQLPLIRVNTPRGKTRAYSQEEFKINDVPKGARNRTKSANDFEFVERCSMAEEQSSSDLSDTPDDHINNCRPFNDGKALKPEKLNRLSSRRRSLSTGDLSLAERIHSFLEGIENFHLDQSDLSNSSESDGEVVLD